MRLLILKKNAHDSRLGRELVNCLALAAAGGLLLRWLPSAQIISVLLDPIRVGATYFHGRSIMVSLSLERISPEADLLRRGILSRG